MSPETRSASLSAAELFVQCLEQEGVEVVFGLPGEETLNLLEALHRSSIRFITTRHEQAAGFMAATYGRLTRRTGVCLATLGPGATNLVTAAAYAQLGGMPMLMITGQKPITMGKQAHFQLIDVVGMMRPLTKFSRTIVNANNIPSRVREAFRLAEEERPGAVHLELPEDIAGQTTNEGVFDKSFYRRPCADDKAVERAVSMLEQCRRPLVCIGAGANRKMTHRVLRQFVEETGIPCIDTQMGLGVVDGRHPLYLGNAALSSGDLIHCAVDCADVILNVGHDVVEKPPFIMRQDGPFVIHVSYNAAEVDPIYFPQVEVVGDLTDGMWRIKESLTPQPHWDFTPFLEIKRLLDGHIARHAQAPDFPCLVARVVHDVRRVMPRDGMVVLDNGLFKIWFARGYRTYEPNGLLLDNALATMGAGLPSAIAAKIVHPEKKVLAVCGDGGVMMNAQELETAVRLNLDLAVLVLKDDAYGMVRFKQESMGLCDFGLRFGNPDFVTYAAAYGASGHRVGKEAAELAPLLDRCLNTKGVHLIEVAVDYSRDHTILVDEVAALIERWQTNLVSKGEGMTLNSINPATDELIRRYPEMTDADIQGCLSRAERGFRRWRDIPWSRRREVLFALKACLERNEEAAAVLITREMGKPIVQARQELRKCAWVCEYYAHHGPDHLTPIAVATEARESFVRFDPLGVVLAVMPWNFPFWQVFRFLAPALMAGNTVVLKHASNVSGCALMIEELVQEAAGGDDLLDVILCSSSRVAEVIHHPAVKAVTLTGSTPAGRRVAACAGEALKKTVLELGGSDPYLVFGDADPHHAARCCVEARFVNSGQSCIAAKRFIVVESVAEAFIDEIIRHMQGLTVGDPMADTTRIGPLARRDLRDALHRQVQESVSKGAELLMGGEIPAGPGAYYPPTLLVNVRPGMPAYHEEMFGPVACVIVVPDEQQAVATANDSPFGLGAAVFTRDIERARDVVARLEAGCCFVNHAVHSDPRLPFGGVKESGYGRELSVFGIREFTNIKTVSIA